MSYMEKMWVVGKEGIPNGRNKELSACQIYRSPGFNLIYR